jgi:hypothetical protein
MRIRWPEEPGEQKRKRWDILFPDSFKQHEEKEAHFFTSK